MYQKSKQHAPKGQKHIAQGNAWGKKPAKTMRPVRAKALIINAFALAGRFAIFNPYTQGAALGYVLLGLSARFVDFWHTLLLPFANQQPSQHNNTPTGAPPRIVRPPNKFNINFRSKNFVVKK